MSTRQFSASRLSRAGRIIIAAFLVFTVSAGVAVSPHSAPEAYAASKPKKPTPTPPKVQTPPPPASSCNPLTTTCGTTGGSGGTSTTPGKGNATQKPAPEVDIFTPGSATCKKPQNANDARCYTLYPGSPDCKTAKWRESGACAYPITPNPQSKTGLAFFNMENPAGYYSAGKGGFYRPNPTPLPSNSWPTFNATVDRYGRTVSTGGTATQTLVISTEPAGTKYISSGNGYVDQCKLASKLMFDPDGNDNRTGGGKKSMKRFYAIGVKWTDTLTWNTLNGADYRTIQYDCVWPADPQPRTLTCPLWGDGLISGALSNSKGLPLMVNGSPLPVTTPREWDPKLKYTPLGQKREGVDANGIKRGSPDIYLGFNPDSNPEGYVKYIQANCRDFNYIESVKTEDCVQISTDKKLSAADCAVVPGNYQNQFRGRQVLCEYTYYPLLFMGRDAYEAEGCFFKKPEISKTVQIAVYCDNRTVVGKWDLTYNFATCDTPPKTAAMCSWSNGSGNPSITDAKGKSILNGSQVIADGEKYKAAWPAPILSGARDPWQQWILTSSGGMNPNLAPDDLKQAFFGHYDKSVSANGAPGMIVMEGSKKGLPGWTKRDFFMSFFDGAKSNGNSLVPFSLEAQFHYYTKKTVTSELNGGTPITYDVMETCRGKEVTFYPLSGRVTQ